MARVPREQELCLQSALWAEDLGMILKMAEGTETHKARKKEYIFHIVYSLGRAHSYSTLLFCPSKVYHIASCFVVS
jgi:hypothetical protein